MKVHCLFDKMVSVHELKPHPKNMNKHPQEQIERLAKILEYQGFRYPIKVSKQSGFITSGHGRLEAAKLLKATHVPVNYQGYVDEAQEYADIVADNAIASWSDLDLAAINHELLSLPDFDLDLLGIEDFKIVEPVVAGCDEDSVPEQVPSVSVLGDLYELGQHRLLCGDSTSIDAVEKLMNGEKADMVLSDPPYGMKLDTDWTGMKGSMGAIAHGTSGKKYKPVAGDGDDFVPELINTFFAAFNYCSEMFLFGADYYAELLPNKNDGSWMVWDKRKDTQADAFGSEFELIWSKGKHKRRMLRHDWFGFLSSGNTKEARDRVHPTQKPTSLLVDILEQWSKSENSIVDLYGGSGSTLIACQKTGRKCYMMELDCYYVSVIIERWMKYTGEMAYLLNDDGTKTSWKDLCEKRREKT